MDMLVKLYDLPSASHDALQPAVAIRRAMPYEGPAVVQWVANEFGDVAKLWPTECEVAFYRRPPSCFIAVNDDEVLGFACFDSTSKGFFGPIGVQASWRGRGVGARLLIETLEAMRADGYGYAIVGNAGSPTFFQRTVAATAIDGSSPGIYTPSLKYMKKQ